MSISKWEFRSCQEDELWIYIVCAWSRDVLVVCEQAGWLVVSSIDRERRAFKEVCFCVVSSWARDIVRLGLPTFTSYSKLVAFISNDCFYLISPGTRISFTWDYFINSSNISCTSLERVWSFETFKFHIIFTWTRAIALFFVRLTNFNNGCSVMFLDQIHADVMGTRSRGDCWIV